MKSRPLTEVLARAQARRQALAGQAFQPLIAAAAAVMLAAVTAGTAPALAWLGARGTEAPASPWPGVTLALATGLLLLLAVALRTRRPVWPFVETRVSQERALVLSAAAALEREGLPLPDALEAAAAHTRHRPLGEAARDAADALGRGEAGGEALFGALGAALFFSAAAQGAGEAALASLAEASEEEVDAALPWALLRAELVALALAGLAVGAAAAGFFATYLSALLGGAA